MFKTEVTFSYPVRGAGRPQVLFLGNGLERCSGQNSWNDLLQSLKHPKSPIFSLQKLAEKEKNNQNEILSHVPFPLQYELYCSNGENKMPQSLSAAREEHQRFAEAIRLLSNEPSNLLSRATTLDADHILTTNYSYCLENSFMATNSGKDVFSCKSKSLSQYRRYLESRELKYRIHTCYVFNQKNSKRITGVWHIHGEISVPKGVVLGHDGYGRILGKITEECRKIGSMLTEETQSMKFRSWPALFLFADIYFLGFSFDLSEFDLWWLLKRKQQERHADGQVYFYERSPSEGFEKTNDPRLLLLQSNGVKLLDLGFRKENENYRAFYETAMEDIRQRIAISRVGSV